MCSTYNAVKEFVSSWEMRAFNVQEEIVVEHINSVFCVVDEVPNGQLQIKVFKSIKLKPLQFKPRISDSDSP